MMRIVADEWMSLDGIVQSPSSPDEDNSNNFGHGGWHMRYFEAESMQWVVDGVEKATAFLYGRRTYETFAAYWPHAGPEHDVLGIPINAKPKYVASKTLTGPLDWHNAEFLPGDAISAVRDLKTTGDGELHVVGSADLVRQLIEAGLVDELRMMIDPVLLGTGKTLFPTDGGLRTWNLASNQVTSTGAILASYVSAA